MAVTEQARQSIGFVGAGIMGQGMAGCLLKSGFPVSVVAHRNRRPIEELVARGATEVGSLAELAERSDTIILCVSNSKVVEAVVSDLTPHLRPGQTLIDTGTSDPESVRQVAAQLQNLGVLFAEAPVTGGKLQAAAGELGALVGSDEQTFQAIQPVLSAFCKKIEHFGPPGAGNTGKLINNYMVMGIIALVTESFEQAARADIDWQKLYDVVTCGSADSGVLRRIIGNAVDGDFKGYVFDVNGASKDIGYYCDMADKLGGTSPLAASVRGLFETAVNNGHGDRLVSELLAPDIRND